MGCLNSIGNFKHWFGNIHLSGPCNRCCYFCIGQHMMPLDQLNNLKQYPLVGMNDFCEKCRKRKIRDVNITGSNTDPMLYRHHKNLCHELRRQIHGINLGINTNGINVENHPEVLALYDNASISITSLNPKLYKATMGCGQPPDLKKILLMRPGMPIKINVVLCPETTLSGDIKHTLNSLSEYGVRTVNLREPYGQPHIGSPLKHPVGIRFGMPRYNWRGIDVTYWDVHYVKVNSVNLYANGRISETYAVTMGCDPTGTVLSQEEFKKSGRHVGQWVEKTG